MCEGCQWQPCKASFPHRDPLRSNNPPFVLKVIQRLIEHVPPERLDFVKSFRGNVYDLSTHPYGCRVLQRCFEHLPDEQTRPLLDELHKYAIHLMQDQFGVSPQLFHNGTIS